MENREIKGVGGQLGISAQNEISDSVQYESPTVSLRSQLNLCENPGSHMKDHLNGLFMRFLVLWSSRRIEL